MRRVCPLSNRCRKREYQGKKLVRPLRIMMAFCVPLLAAVPLGAQSARNSLSGYQEFNSTGVLVSYDPGACDLGFNPDFGPISTAGDRVEVAGNAPTGPLRLASSFTLQKVCADPAAYNDSQQISTSGTQQSVPDTKNDPADENVRASPGLIAQQHERPDRNLDIYYRNRTEFSVDVGWHPVNIPFIYDFAVGDGYNMTPLKYTLVPIVASLRWHVTNVGWRWIFRGNMDFTFSGSITAIPRGPETHYYSLDFGIRRNFVYRNWKVVPFFEQRGGAGIINAKEPLGVLFAQGQNLTFTYNLGVGVRYNIDSKYSFSAGMNYMHISNAYLSQPQFYNYGINVYGPMFGVDVRLGKPRDHASE
jgi:Lipid A 3-O-deacylase (PagL)